MNQEKTKVFQPQIRAKKITLENFRGFEHLEMEFQPDLTVFIGENGAGKTTILDGLAKLLLVFEKKMRSKRVDLRGVFEELDIRYEAVESTNSLGFCLADNELNWKITFTKTSYQKPQVNNYKALNSFRETINLELRHQKPVNLPVVIYYPTIHAPVDSIAFKNTIDYLLQTDIFTALDGTLDPKKSFDFIKFFYWYKWQENIEKQIGENQILDVVRYAIYNILSDQNNQFNQLSINWLNDPNGEMIIHKGEIPLNINQLSSGEKMLMALVADLACRLAIANPHRENPLMGNGIVLIDEIDLHLHPRRQRNVIPQLQKIFPNCQLIVTSHSPLVLSQVQQRCVVLLEEFNPVKNTPHTFGRDTHSILYELMGVTQRPDEIQQQIDLVYEWIDDGKTEQAQALLKTLSEHLGDNDVAIVRAYTHLAFMGDDYEAH